MKKLSKYGLVIVGALVLIGFALRGTIVNEPFDSEKWKSWTESEAEWTLRWDMMNSLRNQHELKGKTKTEIIELLGEPTSQRNSSFIFNLGPSGHGISYGYLRLSFNEDERVIDFMVGEG